METHKIEELINEYKENVFICRQINYNDKKSIKLNNRAVDRMYRIINIINADLGEEEINEFSKLLDIEDYGTNVWVAVQMLEKIKVKDFT